jgi:hypothetical protein
MADTREAVTLMCWWCLQPMVWDDQEKKLWCPTCNYVMPNG